MIAWIFSGLGSTVMSYLLSMFVIRPASIAVRAWDAVVGRFAAVADAKVAAGIGSLSKDPNNSMAARFGSTRSSKHRDRHIRMAGCDF